MVPWKEYIRRGRRMSRFYLLRRSSRFSNKAVSTRLSGSIRLALFTPGSPDGQATPPRNKSKHSGRREHAPFLGEFVCVGQAALATCLVLESAGVDVSIGKCVEE